MIWTIPEIIAEASKLWTLAAGDLIFTGTPEGVAAIGRGDRVEGRDRGRRPADLHPGRGADHEPHPAQRLAVSAAYRVRIGLNLKGLAYDIAPVNLVASQHLEPAFGAAATPSTYCRPWRSTAGP